MQPYTIFCKSLQELPQSVCSVWFSHLTILEWWQWSRLSFNQSIEILGFIPPFFVQKHRWVSNFDPPLGLLEAHARCPSLPSVGLLGFNLVFCHDLVARKKLCRFSKMNFQGEETFEGFFSIDRLSKMIPILDNSHALSKKTNFQEW